MKKGGPDIMTVLAVVVGLGMMVTLYAQARDTNDVVNNISKSAGIYTVSGK